MTVMCLPKVSAGRQQAVIPQEEGVVLTDKRLQGIRNRICSGRGIICKGYSADKKNHLRKDIRVRFNARYSESCRKRRVSMNAGHNVRPAAINKKVHGYFRRRRQLSL